MTVLPRIASLALVLSTVACTSAPRADDASAPATVAAPPVADAGTPANKCNADAAQSAVGQVATKAVVEQARTDAGATVVRTLKPGQMVTMEYRFDRLNLRVDVKNVVQSVGCG